MTDRTSPVGNAEMRIFQYVADHPPATVRQVADHFAEASGLARTTVLTVMERLREKKLLSRKKVGGVFHYSPRLETGRLQASLVKDFVERTLGGSVTPFLAYLTEAKNLSPEQIESLRKIVDELEGSKEDEP
jgi:predicted transcriptional regulator